VRITRSDARRAPPPWLPSRHPLLPRLAQLPLLPPLLRPRPRPLPRRLRLLPPRLARAPLPLSPPPITLAVEAKLVLPGRTAMIPPLGTTRPPRLTCGPFSVPAEWLLSLTGSSLYTWSPSCPSSAAKLGFNCIPMLWGDNQISQFQSLVKPGYATHVLAINE
jgi:hypothetical protein